VEKLMNKIGNEKNEEDEGTLFQMVQLKEEILKKEKKFKEKEKKLNGI